MLTGYRGEQIEHFVAAERWPADAEIRCLDTGADTPTGGRVHLAAAELEGSDFCLTYADGVANIDLEALLEYHAGHEAPATMTVVRPELQFGVAELDAGGAVTGFVEKPRSEHWINGGFFCLRPPVLDLLSADSILEREPLQSLAATGGLRGFRHEGSGIAWTPTRTRCCSTTCGRGATRRGSCGRERSARPHALVTGAHGLLGGWLVKALLEHGVRVVTIRRDEPTASPLAMLGVAASVDVVHGDICDPGLVARVLNEYEVDSVFHLAAQTHRRHRQPRAAVDVRDQHPGTWLRSKRRGRTAPRA